MTQQLIKIKTNKSIFKRFFVCFSGCFVFFSIVEIPAFWRLQPLVVQAQTLQVQENEAFKLYEQGVQDYQQSRFREALENFENALVIFTEIGQRQYEGITLNNIGEVYRSLGQYSQALEYYQKALSIARSLGDQESEGVSLNNIGLVYDSQGQYSQALDYYQQSLKIARDLNDLANVGIYLNNIGAVYKSQGQYSQALDYYQQSLKIARDLNDLAGAGATLSNIGTVYKNQGNYTQALDYYQQALSITREIGYKAGVGIALNNIGDVYKNQGQYTQALENYQEALKIARDVGDLAGVGAILNNIGAAYKSLGQYAQALENYQQALKIADDIGDRAMEGIILNNIGLVYEAQGQYSQGLDYFQKALKIADDIGNQSGKRAALNSIGGAYKSLGQSSQALENYQQALKIARDIGDRAGEGTILNNMGEVFQSLSQYSQALEAYQEALKIARDIGDRAGEGTALNNIGATYESLGKYSQALESYQQALKIARDIGDRAGEGIILNNIGAVYQSLEQNSQAFASYQEALNIARELGNRASEGIILNNIGAAYQKLGQYAEAEQALLASLEVQESLRTGLTDSQKVSFFDTQTDSYSLLEVVLIAQNKTNSALEISERGRARAFVELLAQKFSETPETPLKIEPPNLAKIQQIAKDHHATLVQYSILQESFKIDNQQVMKDSQLFVWVIKPTGEIIFRRVDLKPLWQQQNTSLAQLVLFTREAMGVRGLGVVSRLNSTQATRQPQSLKTLHNLLIEPIADVLPSDPNERVIFIPKSALFLVPFAALQDDLGMYLIEKHTILTAPSIQVLELTQKQREINKTGSIPINQRQKQDFLIVGNPQMPAVSIPSESSSQLLSSLPGAETEAKVISALFNTQPLIGNQATETLVKHQMSTAKFIHLATHGIIEDLGFGIPGAIALTPSGKDDGLLTAGEIFDLSLNAELVVLSACNTGQGQITGDGVIGLSRSFISAGTPSVLVSLWAVPDSPTAELMTQFYQNLQTQPDKAQALRQAMLTTKQKHPNPVDWAAFTLIGEAD